MTSIKTILAAVSGGSASAGTAELACRLARRFGAHVEGFYAKPHALDLIPYGAAIGSRMSDAFVEKFAAEADEAAAKVRSQFVAALARQGIDLGPDAPGSLPGIIGPTATWHEETGDGPSLVALRARFFDLVVLGRSERVIKEAHSDTVEETLLLSGRPVLLAPATPPDSVGERVVVGWNGTAEAVRAMVTALPFFAAARETFIVTIGPRYHDSARSAVDYLAWHDIQATHLAFPPEGIAGAGEFLLNIAKKNGADLVVLGGYGSSPWHEFLFGGTTRQVIGASLLPILLTH